MNDVVFRDVNNGVYRCGFAGAQEAYDKAYDRLFARLDWLSDRLAHQRYLVGDTITEADVRLFTTLARFDAVYHGHFKCNRNKLSEMPVLWAYARDLFQTPGFGDTIDFVQIKQHYYVVHTNLNPSQIVPKGPDLSGWFDPHDRDELGGRPFGDGTPPTSPPVDEMLTASWTLDDASAHLQRLSGRLQHAEPQVAVRGDLVALARQRCRSGRARTGCAGGRPPCRSGPPSRRARPPAPAARSTPSRAPWPAPTGWRNWA